MIFPISVISVYPFPFWLVSLLLLSFFSFYFPFSSFRVSVPHLLGTVEFFLLTYFLLFIHHRCEYFLLSLSLPLSSFISIFLHFFTFETLAYVCQFVFLVSITIISLTLIIITHITSMFLTCMCTPRPHSFLPSLRYISSFLPSLPTLPLSPSLPSSLPPSLPPPLTIFHGLSYGYFFPLPSSILLFFRF